MSDEMTTADPETTTEPTDAPTPAPSIPSDFHLLVTPEKAGQMANATNVLSPKEAVEAFGGLQVETRLARLESLVSQLMAAKK